MIFFSSWVFDAEFLTRAQHAFEERFKTKPEIVTFSHLDLMNYHREKDEMPDTQGIRMEASENLLQSRMLLQAKKATWKGEPEP